MLTLILIPSCLVVRPKCLAWYIVAESDAVMSDTDIIRYCDIRY